MGWATKKRTQHHKSTSTQNTHKTRMKHKTQHTKKAQGNGGGETQPTAHNKHHKTTHFPRPEVPKTKKEHVEDKEGKPPARRTLSLLPKDAVYHRKHVFWSASRPLVALT